MTTLNTQGIGLNQSSAQAIAVTGLTSLTIPSTSTTNTQWISSARMKVEPGSVNNTNVLQSGVAMSNHSTQNHSVGVSSSAMANSNAQALSLDCYEDMFKEITKKLYGSEDLTLIADSADPNATGGSIIYETDGFRTDPSGAITFVNANGLPPGTFVIQRRIQDDKGLPQAEQLALATAVPSTSHVEERWFESDGALSWTTSKIARYNPIQKVFRCVDCDFVGFLSRVAEHWLGNHASLRVFQCPRCPYTSAWARCVRMHMTRQHGEAQNDNSLWKENPVLEEVTKFLNTLKTRVEQKADTGTPGEKRYLCQFCSYSTDRRDLFNRHENIHRDEKPFQCFVCEKQFNRADHVKKHFTRMHREHTYDLSKIRKHIPKPTPAASATGVSVYQSSRYKPLQITDAGVSDGTLIQISGGSEVLSQIPHLAYFSPQPTVAAETPPPSAVQGIQGVGGDKKGSKGGKSKGQKKKKQGDKMYTCSYCPWQGVDNWCLKRHLNTHIKPFLCALCDYKAARSERLATHVLKVHNKRVCHKCSFLADDPASLVEHVQDSHQNPLVKTGYNCNVCQEYFELRADMEAHAILEHQKVIVQCDLCDFRTTDEVSMETHLREKHNLQPGMGAVAAAAAAAAAAAVSQSQQVMVPYNPQVIQLQPDHQMPMPALQRRQVQVQIPTPSLQSVAMIKQEHQHQEITGDHDINTSLIQAYHIDETISNVLALAPESEADKVPDLSCDFCGCEFYDEESAKLHQKGHELRKSDPPELRNSKLISRHYTCSTCSYNSATSRIMMQHQRIHSGFELECRAEGCWFSTPFENTLKEHIHVEHNNETEIRCPHCAYLISSLVDFTFHWRIHHSSVCSLCIGLYRLKYGMKEPDIQEFVFRTPYEILEFRKPENDTKPKEGMPPAIHHPEGEPVAKRPREFLNPIFSSITNYFNHSSINFLPRAIDISVTSLTPPVDTISTPRPQKKIWERKFDRRHTREKVLRYTIRRLISTNKNYSVPLRLERRGTGFKCFQQRCRYKKSIRYIRKSSYYLHQLIVHRKRWIKCEDCDLCFTYLYKALLHSRRVHPIKRNTRKINEILHHNNNNSIPPRLVFKQERQ